eukprot:3785946-Amphidinium_carterae.1
MRERGIEPNVVSYSAMINACAMAPLRLAHVQSARLLPELLLRSHIISYVSCQQSAQQRLAPKVK